MRLTAWHTALSLSATAHVAAFGWAAVRLAVAPPGETRPDAIRLTVVAAPAAAAAAPGRRHVEPVDRPPVPNMRRLLARAETGPIPDTLATPNFPMNPAHSGVSAPVLAAAPRLPGSRSPFAQPDTTALENAAVSAAASSASDAAPARPVAGANPPPGYPRRARLNGWEGRVLLEVDSNAEGRVTAIAVRESSGYVVLDDAAMTAVRGWRFMPARSGGVTFPSTVRVPVVFRLDEAAPDP